MSQRISGHFSFIDFQAEAIRAAKWEIQVGEQPAAGIAHVETFCRVRWIDGIDELKLRWLFRKEPAGWRITGAIVLLDKDSGLILDFEDELQMRRETVNIN